ncbi:hypothetical protein MJN85_27310, partial [Salmonella enterica subsp. enterica serovar Anatum]|nr:hypothetical protein [Salmonella enterica subsp. enterica serovar Anatum]
EGVERAQYLIDQLLSEARKGGVKVAAGAGASNYINTIAVEDEPCAASNIILNVLRMSFPSLPQRVGHSATLPQNFWQRLGVTTKERSSA